MPKRLRYRIEAFDERQFYLEEFRNHALVLSLAASDLVAEDGEHQLAALANTLIANGTELIILVSVQRVEEVQSVRRTLRRRLQPKILSHETLPLFRDAGKTVQYFHSLDMAAFDAPADAVKLIAQIWSVLRSGPLFVGVVAHADETDAVRFAAMTAARLRAHKLVVMQPSGGLVAGDGKPISFMDEATMAALLATGQAEWAGMGERRPTVASLRHALLGGVGSANLCTLREAARELFTYEGSGTLFTLEDYCRVDRLGIDDFPEAEQLIERGHREGVLKPRSPEQVAELLASGYGATIGASHLAGICALVTAPYRDEQVGEIVGLYTITRFKGEGVGARLIEKAIDDARQLGLRYVFATTTVDRAQQLFERCGLRQATPADVPAGKWLGYDPQRRSQVTVLRIDLHSPRL
ncbi:MAG TPA: GNAT family N-acetyltransferase [Terriglobales bacterium]|nr:GNAT family N-acetyltransferase [Terriglobales bacterium]